MIYKIKDILLTSFLRLYFGGMIKTLALLIFVNTFAFSQTSLSASELDIIKENLKSGSSSELIEPDTPADLSPKEISIESPILDIVEMDYFGYDYFLRDISFFDNIPTPVDFKLGSGDEVVISMWGQRNIQETFTLNKDGSIFYKNIGFINLSNKTLNEAEEFLIEILSKTYSTLKDESNPTKLKLSLGGSKSVNVFLTGFSNNPGVHLIHPFSDIYSAITQSGGVSFDGSLRNIKLIRNGEKIADVDFYSFFIEGLNTFSKIRLLDGDIIHIPSVSKRAEISGEVLRPGNYELKENENLENLINYAGGITSNAQSKAILDLVIPIKKRVSSDLPNESKLVDIATNMNHNLTSGSTVNILSVSNSSNKVTIVGTVKTPGEYPVSNLREILDTAGGFQDPTFEKKIKKDTIAILRKDDSQIYAEGFKVSYDESINFILEAEDIIIVYSNSNYREPITLTIEGEVINPGTFLYQDGMQVKHALDLAKGITIFGDKNAIEVYNNITGDKINNITLDTELPVDARIVIPRINNVVRVEGSVYNPRTLVFESNQTLSKYIESAGGLNDNADKREIQIIKSNGDIKKVNLFFGKIYGRIDSNDTILVPTKEESTFDAVELTSNIVSLLTNLATIIFIVDSNN